MEKTLTKILCIDDDNDILFIEKIALETNKQFEIFICDNSARAIETIEEVFPDLILLDVMMPEIDGTEIKRLLKENPRLCDIPVIFMTAKVQPNEVALYHTMGVAGVIQKPFDPMLLSQEVTKLWGAFVLNRGKKTPPVDSITEIKLTYLKSLKQQVSMLTNFINHCKKGSLTEPQFQGIRHIAHKLTGSGGTYGFITISQTARALITSLESNDLYLIRQAIENLLNAIATAETTETGESFISLGLKTSEKPQILLIGEGRATVDILLEAFHQEIDVISVSSSEDAVNITREQPIQLIMIGDRISKAITLALLKQFMHDPTTSKIPIIMLVDDGELSELMPFISTGATDYVIKPLEPTSFIAKVRDKLKWQQTTIMLVDDDPDIRQILEHRFHSAGINVILAADGEEALLLAEKQKPQLLVLDIMMPGLDGIALLQKLRMQDAFKTIPVLFLTAKRNEVDILEGFRLGAQDYVVKPFIPEEVLARCLRLLEQNEQKNE